MNHDELDRILSAEQEILPSSGFTASVMEAVRREASAPPPIPFPWKRLLPALLAGAAVLTILLVGAIVQLRGGAPAVQAPSAILPALSSMLTVAQRFGAQWIVLALLVTAGSLWFPLRLAAEESLTR
jgi:hypothetical protein